MIRDSGKDIGERLLRREQAAELLGLSARTLACWRSAGRGPEPVKFGVGRSAAVRYAESEVRAYMADPVAYDAAHRVREQVRFAPPPRRMARRRKSRA
jgi:predicted DNA-binding transcriptional regulator AlpA